MTKKIHIFTGSQNTIKISVRSRVSSECSKNPTLQPHQGIQNPKTLFKNPVRPFTLAPTTSSSQATFTLPCAASTITSSPFHPPTLHPEKSPKKHRLVPSASPNVVKSALSASENFIEPCVTVRTRGPWNVRGRWTRTSPYVDLTVR